MSTVVENIRREIDQLAPDEVQELFAELNRSYSFGNSHSNSDEEEDLTVVEAEWDAEIAARVKDVEEGRVKLISGQESEQRIDALFAKHGLQRRVA